MKISRLYIRSLFICLCACLFLPLLRFDQANAQPADPPKPAPTVEASAVDAVWNALTPEVQAKVDPRLLAEFRGDVTPAHLANVTDSPSVRNAPVTQTRFLVILHDQADVEAMAQRVYASAADQRNAVAAELADYAQRSQSALRTLLNARQQMGGVTGYQPFSIVNAVAVEGDLATLATLAPRPEVARIVANYPLLPVGFVQRASSEPAAGATEAETAEYPWNIPFTGVDQVWKSLNVRGEGAVVGGFDTGVYYTHPALVNAYRGYVEPNTFNHNYNWFEPDDRLYPNGNLGPSASSAPYDCDSHGTHTMGTMVGDGGSADTAIGMAPGARWIAVPGICNRTMPGKGISDDIGGLKAFQWFLCPTDLSGNLTTADCSKAPDVINNSWGSANPANTLFQPALRALRAAGTTIVFAAGNTGRPGSIGSPGHLPEAITVGAVDRARNIAYFSSQGPAFERLELKPNLSAPGMDVLSSVDARWYIPGSGTSMAAPHVAGLVALLVSADLKDGFRDFSVDEIEHFILATVAEGGAPGPDYLFGAGTMDAFRAVRWALSAGEVTGVISAAQGGAPIDGVEIHGVNIDTGDLFTSTTDSQGAFSFSAPAGRYTITLRHLLYESATHSNQPVLTGSLLTANFQMRAKPRAPLTGVVRTGNGPAVGARISLKTSTPVQTTAGADGDFSLSVPAGSYTLVVEARGHKHFEQAVTVPAQGMRVDVALTPAPTILLVNADASAGWFLGWPVHPFLAWALTEQGYLYDYWEIQYTDFFDQKELIDGSLGSGVPSVATLRNYDVVVWVHSGCSGYASYRGCTWGTPARVNADTVLAEYLDGGGRLLISGQDIGRSDGDQGLYDLYLKADLKYDYGAIEGTQISGLYFLDGLSLEVTNASLYGSPNSVSDPSPDAVATSGGAFPILQYGYTGEVAALAVAPCSEDYRAVYLAMGYENIAPRADMRSADMSALISRSLEWLVGSDAVLLYHINSMATQQSGEVGSRQNYAIVLENNGRSPLKLSVALAGAQWPVTLSSAGGPIGDAVVVGACDSLQLSLSVQIPPNVPIDATDAVTLTVVAPEASIPTQQQTYVTRALPQWRLAAPIPIGRYGASVAKLADAPEIYVIGGRDNNLGSLADVERYDPCSDLWTTLDPLPQALAFAAAAAIGRQIYVVGGSSDIAQILSEKLWIYDMDGKSWREGAPLPLKLLPGAAAVWHDRLYVFGGVSESSMFSSVLYYDVALNQWISAGTLPFISYPYSLSAATWNDEIYIVHTDNPWEGMFVLNPVDGTWRRVNAHTLPRYRASLVAEGDYLYLVGGSFYSSIATERYDPRQDRWLTLSAQITSRASASVAASTDRLISVGGEYGAIDTEILSLRPNYCDSSAQAISASVGAGEAFPVQVKLETGANPVEDGDFTAPLPAEVTFEGFVENPVGAAYNPATHSVGWQGSLPANTTTSVVFTVRGSAATPPQTWYSGNVTFGSGGRRFTRQWRTLVLQADFSPSIKVAGAETIIEGERLTYTIDLHGRTPIGGDLHLQDLLPGTLSVIPDSWSATVGEIVFEPVQNLIAWSATLPNRLDAVLNITDNYQWGDSNGAGEVAGVDFVWDDISLTGRAVATGDDVQICDLPIGFDFPFYGQSFSTLCLSTNGFVTFGAAHDSTYITCQLPNGYGGGLIAGYAQDLVVEGAVYAQSVGEAPNRRLILQWKDVRRFNVDTNPTIDFQIILFESGSVDVDFLRVPASRNSYTVIGLQSPTAKEGATYTCGSRTLTNRLTVKFLAPGASSAGPTAQLRYAVSLAPGLDANYTLTNTAVMDTPAGPITRTASVLANPLYLDTSTAKASVADAPVKEPFTYQFELRNTGRVAAARAEMYNDLPPYLDYLPDTLACSSGACTAAGKRILWQGAIAPGGVVTVAYSATVGIDAVDQTIVTNTAQINDGFGGITEVSAAVRARQAELAGSFVEFDPPIVRPGDMVTYTIYLRNSGGGSVNADVYHDLPVGMTYMPGSLWCGAGLCEMQGSTIYWQGSLNRRVIVPVRVRVQLAPWLAEGSSVMGFLVLQRHDRPDSYRMLTHVRLAQRYFLGIVANPNWRLFLPETHNHYQQPPIVAPTPEIPVSPLPTPNP